MRHNQRYFLAFAVVIVCCQAVISQTKEVTYADVFKMEQTGMQLLRSVPHRSTMTSWVFPGQGKKAEYHNVLVRETVSPDRSRWVQENFTPGSFRRMEVVMIGDQNYRKVDDGQWQVLEPPKSYDRWDDPASTNVSKPRFENSARFIETVNDDKGPVFVYETVSRLTQEQAGKDVTSVRTTRLWVRYDGFVLRKDSEMETVGDPKLLKNSTVYEYDGIKIEAPIK